MKIDNKLYSKLNDSYLKNKAKEIMDSLSPEDQKELRAWILQERAKREDALRKLLYPSGWKKLWKSIKNSW